MMKSAVTAIPALDMLEPRLLLSVTPTLAALADTAQTLSLSALTSTEISDEITTSGETCVYEVTSAARGVISILMSASDGSSLDSYLTIYTVSSSGKVSRLAYNNNSSSSTLDSLIRRSVADGQTLYIVASGYKGSTGQFDITITTTPVDDVGNTTSTAKTIALKKSVGSGTKTGTINYSEDVDYFSVKATKTGVLEIVLSQYGRSSALYGTLLVYNSSGELVAQSTDTDTSTTAAVSVSVTLGETYYVVVASRDGSIGAYKLSFTTSDPPADTTEDTTDDTTTDTTTDDASTTTTTVTYTAGATITTYTVTLSDGLQLIVVGTNSADVITLSQAASYVTMVTSVGTTTIAGAFTSIVMYGFAGADTLRLTYSVTASSIIYAGDDNDTIYENSAGSATVYAGSGADFIVSVGGGADKVYGEAGTDTVWYDSSDTLADGSSAESTAKSLHKITSFYQATSTSAVSLNIDGQELVDPTTSYSYKDFSSYALFVDGPEYSDIKQGNLGDCYLVAALASLAQTDPSIVIQTVASLGDGTYVVQFYRNGTATYVRVDADLPVYSSGSLAYAKLSSDGELWVAIIEKAYAQFRYGMNSYSSIEGGMCDTVYKEITGESTKRVYTYSYTAASMASYLSTQLSLGYALTAGSYSTSSNGIVGSHAYMITSVQASGSSYTVTLYNPWGSSLTISIEDFVESFCYVFVSLA